VIDSHCHLDFPDFDADCGEVFARARAAEVTSFINPGCDLASSERALALARDEKDVFCGVGLHPSEAAAFTPDLMTTFENMAADPKVVAIGECGLDFVKNNASREQQEVAFRAQIVLAQKLDLPLIIHSRGAEARSVDILKEYDGLCGVLHCYTGDVAPAVQAAELGFMIGFTGIVTFKNATLVQEAVKALPLEKILIETDAPFLSPEPYRGERAEPAYVVEVAKKIAELKELSVEEVAAQTAANTRELFSL